MGACIDKIHCDNCGSKTLQVFLRDDDDVDGFCFSCSSYVRHPYGTDKPAGWRPEVKIKSQDEIFEEIKEINDYQTVTLHDRRLNAATLAEYGIKIGLSQADAVTPVSHHYPYKVDGVLQAYKNRIIENKQMWSVGEMKGVDLFGWDVAMATGAKRLYITEGELDACALWQMIMRQQKGTQYADRTPAVVSLTRGCSNAANDITNQIEKIRRNFKEVVLVFDQDEPGKAAEEEVLKIAPDFMTVDLPEKDANACLLAGKTKACVDACMWKATVPKNTRLVFGEDLHEDAKVPAEYGVSWPWKGMTDMTRGIRTGETIYIGAAQKMGKSEVVNALAVHLIKVHGWKIMLCKPEEANKKSYKMMAGKVAGTTFIDPKVEFDAAAFDRAGDVLKGKLTMLNLYQHVGWESLKTDIRAAAAWGAKAIFVDPLTQLSNGLSAAEANTKLQEVAQELAAMALDLDVVIFIFCHLRNPDQGVPHDRGGKVLTGQFAGSRAMGRSCNYMIGIEGNKDPELNDEDRNQRKLVLLDDREFGEVGEVPLFWNKHTTLFEER
jgi:twinkle protein